MAPTIVYGGETIRINPSKGCIEYSTNDGRTWHARFRGSSSSGNFISLLGYGSELLAITSIGVLYSSNSGRTWHLRFRNSSSTGDFIDIYDNGKELLGDTSVGLFYSTNSGKTWHLRKRK